MRKIVLLGAGALAWQCAQAALPIPGDPSRGAEVFRDQQCIACHAVGGQGGKSAPDLGNRLGRAYTPNVLAGAMWSHAAAMWPAMEKAGIRRQSLTPEQAADLFAYFAAGQPLEATGNATRGAALWNKKGCANCHAAEVLARQGTGAPDLVGLAQAMWNHAPAMAQAHVAKRLNRPTLTSQELADLAAHMQAQPGARKPRPGLSLASSDTGKELFALKGCQSCHTGSHTLTDKLSGRSPADFAAAMWNHAAKMGTSLPELRDEEMRRIAGYLWSIQYFEPKGDAARGRQVFARKACDACHGDPTSGAPDLKRNAGAYNSFTLISGLWQHGAGMLSRMVATGREWQRFTPAEIGDIIAFLNAR